MRQVLYVIAGCALVLGCTAVEDLQGDALEARLSGTELRFPSEADETIVIALQPGGRGVVRDTFPGTDRPDRVDQVSWAVAGNQLCVTGDGPGEVSTSGRTECIAIAIAGDRITAGTGDDPLIGTISPL